MVAVSLLVTPRSGEIILGDAKGAAPATRAHVAGAFLSPKLLEIVKGGIVNSILPEKAESDSVTSNE